MSIINCDDQALLQTDASPEWVETICEAAINRIFQSNSIPNDANEFACNIAELYVDTHPQDLRDWYAEHEGTEFMLNCEQYMIDNVGNKEATKASHDERLHMLQFFAIARIAKTLLNNLTQAAINMN